MQSPRRSKPDDGRRGVRGKAIVWKRYDFRESSRIVALLLREHGVVHALAKGAHRPTSPLLGRIDFLSELDVSLSATAEGLRTLLRAELSRERRGLRAPSRFLAASHVADVFDAALTPGRPDPELFDLVDGGLALVELCPLRALPSVLLGLELRLLHRLGALPDFDACAECGASLAAGAFVGEVAGSLSCRGHAASPRRAVGKAPLATLRQLRDLPGRAWPEIVEPPAPSAIALVGQWIGNAIERRCRLRAAAFSRTGAEPARARDEG